MTHQLRLFEFDEGELLEALQSQSNEERALAAATAQAQSAKERQKLCHTAYEEACKRVSRLTHEATMKTARIKDLEQVEAEVVEDPADTVMDAEETTTESDSRSIVLMQRDGDALRMREGEGGEDLRTPDQWEASGKFSGDGQAVLAPGDDSSAETALVATGHGR